MSEDIKDKEIKTHQACEPIGGAARVDYAEPLYSDERELADVPLGKYGFYTSDPDVFEQRVAMIEDALDKVDAGMDDPSEWIQVDDFMATMRKEHPWL